MAAAQPGHAWAFDWKIDSTLSEKVQIDDNIQLSPTGNEVVFGSTSSALLKAMAKSHVGQLDLDAKYGFTRFVGFDGIYDSKNVDNTIGGKFTKKTTSTTFSLGGRVSQVSTFFSEADDTTLTSNDTNNVTYAADGSLTRKLNQTDDLILSTYFKRSTFDAVTAGLNENDTYGGSTKFSRKVNHSLSSGLKGAVDVFEPATGGNTRYTITGDLTKKLTDELTVSGQVGIRFVVTDGSANLANTTTLTPTTGNKTTVGYPLDFKVNYKGKSRSASAGFNRNVSPSSSGSLNSSTSVSASFSQTINQYVNVGLNGSYSITESTSSTGTTSERTSYSVSPTLKYKLTRDWSVDLGYQYRVRDTGTTEADSNKVFLTLTHNTTLLP